MNERCGPHANEARLVAGLACRQVHSGGPDIGRNLLCISVRFRNYCGQHGGRMPERVSRRSFSVRRLLNILPNPPADHGSGILASAVDPSVGNHLEPISVVAGSQREEMARTDRTLTPLAMRARGPRSRVAILPLRVNFCRAISEN